MKYLVRPFLAFVAFAALVHFSVPLAILACVLCLIVSPRNLMVVGAAYPAITGSTLSQLVAAGGADVQEVLWTMKVLESAAQNSPFADNMTGAPGSGKPIIVNTDTSKVLGNQIVFNTVDSLGAPGVQGNGIRVGSEEQLKPGDFRLTVDIQWFGTGMDNTALSQSVIGAQYPEISRRLLARILAKKESDDVMQDLKCEANATNTIYANNHTIDTLLSTDTYNTSMIISGNGLLKDIGALPTNLRPNPDKATEEPPPINEYLQFGTDVGMRPIKIEPNYVQAAQLAMDRGEKNNLFTGKYLSYDGAPVYPWVNVRHGGYGSIGSALQPEALLGTALTGRTTNSGVLPAGSGILDGGGSATNAAITPLRNYFEFWSLFAYKPINGVTRTYSPHGSSIAYGLIIDKTSGKIAFFSYTGNTGNTLTGVVMAGASSSGNYSASAIGGVTYGSGNFTTDGTGTGAGNGFLGITEGTVASGSLMMECNSKGVPLCFAFGLGEMAVVCGYGRVPINGGQGFKSMASRTEYQAPHGQAVAYGIQVAWGTAAFKRPDGTTPNFVLEVFARSQSGVPNILS